MSLMNIRNRNITFKNECKICNFEVHVEFKNQQISQSTADVITLIINSVDTEYKDSVKYLNLYINSYCGTCFEESCIPEIGTIKINRYDEQGKLLLTSVYNNCKFVCNNFTHLYQTNNLNSDESKFARTSLQVIYKFSYDDMTMLFNEGEK